MGQSLKRTPHFLQAFHSHMWKPLHARPWVGSRGLGARQAWPCSQEAGDPGGRPSPSWTGPGGTEQGGDRTKGGRIPEQARRMVGAQGPS